MHAIQALACLLLYFILTGMEPYKSRIVIAPWYRYGTIRSIINTCDRYGNIVFLAYHHSLQAMLQLMVSIYSVAHKCCRVVRLRPFDINYGNLPHGLGSCFRKSGIGTSRLYPCLLMRPIRRSLVFMGQ
jgi:hypothetical protein